MRSEISADNIGREYPSLVPVVLNQAEPVPNLFLPDIGSHCARANDGPIDDP